MTVAEITVNEGLIVIVAVIAVLQGIVTFADRRVRKLRDELGEKNELIHRLEAKLAVAEGRPDMTTVAQYLAESRELSHTWVTQILEATERHEQRAEARAEAQLQVLRRIAEALEVNLNGGH